jgi:lipopolysaccharide export system permease protein
MKKLQLLVLQSFLPPFLASFSVGLFVLVLQFMTSYQDDIFGKGFGAWVITQLYLFTAVQLSVLALPIAVLVAGLNTMGKLGETYELVAMKSAGISVFKVMHPLIVFTMGVVGLSFYLSTTLVPAANLQLYSLLYDAQRAKPELALTPGVFDSKFDGYTIYFRARGNAGLLKQVMIWDHTQSPTLTKVVRADSARMQIDNRLLYLRLTLYHGEQHEEQAPNNQPAGVGYSRTLFDTLYYKFDLSGFGLKRMDEDAFKNHQYMLSMSELKQAADSLKTLLPPLYRQIADYDSALLPIQRRLAGAKKLVQLPRHMRSISNAIDGFPKEQHASILNSALVNTRATKLFAENTLENTKFQEGQMRRYQIEYYLKFSLPLACLLMLFIGAPLGAIIRRGGLGAPTLLALLFFILFYVLMTHGRKLAREGYFEVWFGVFFPLIVMFPMAFYITYQSATDSKLFDLSSWRILGESVLRLLRTCGGR